MIGKARYVAVCGDFHSNNGFNYARGFLEGFQAMGLVRDLRSTFGGVSTQRGYKQTIKNIFGKDSDLLKLIRSYGGGEVFVIRAEIDSKRFDSKLVRKELESGKARARVHFYRALIEKSQIFN